MPQDKPLLVYIYGPNISYPSYQEVMEAKVDAEAAGQPWLLIPEPARDAAGSYAKENGSYVPSTAVEDLSITHINDTLERHFAPGGSHEGRAFTAVVDMHGNIINGEHIHRFANGNYIDSTHIFDSLLSPRDAEGKNLCEGIFDGACHSTASLISVARSITGGKGLQRDLHFFAVAPFDNVSWLMDVQSLAKAIPALAKQDVPLTVENLKRQYLRTAGDEHIYRDAAVAEKRFFAGEPIDPEHIRYESFEQKLDYIMRYREDFIREYGANPQWSPMLDALKNYTSANALKLNLQYAAGEAMHSGNYADYLQMADDMFDDYAAKHRLNIQNASVTHSMLRVYNKDFSALEGLGRDDRMRTLTALTGAEGFLFEHEPWKPMVSPQDRDQLLKLAALSLAENPPESPLEDKVFRHAPVWLQAVDGKERDDILKTAILNVGKLSPKHVLSHVDMWEQGLQENEKKQTIKNIAEKTLRSSPDLLMEKFDKWRRAVEPEDTINMLRVIATDRPRIFLEHFSGCVEHVPAGASRMLLRTAVENLNKSYYSPKSTERDIIEFLNSVGDPQKKEALKKELEDILKEANISDIDISARYNEPPGNMNAAISQSGFVFSDVSGDERENPAMALPAYSAAPPATGAKKLKPLN